MQDKLDAAHVKVEDQMEKYQKLNESTSNERERYTKQLSSHTTEKLQFQAPFFKNQDSTFEINIFEKPEKTHIAQLEAENKQLQTKYEEMKKQAVDAVTLVKTQDEAKPSEVQNLQDENDKLTQQIEDLNLQLLQQHIAKDNKFRIAKLKSRLRLQVLKNAIAAPRAAQIIAASRFSFFYRKNFKLTLEKILITLFLNLQ